MRKTLFNLVVQAMLAGFMLAVGMLLIAVAAIRSEVPYFGLTFLVMSMIASRWTDINYKALRRSLPE